MMTFNDKSPSGISHTKSTQKDLTNDAVNPNKIFSQALRDIGNGINLSPDVFDLAIVVNSIWYDSTSDTCLYCRSNKVGFVSRRTSCLVHLKDCPVLDAKEILIKGR